jgi:KDO2-lipid IV(A) lauroyltransferase
MYYLYRLAGMIVPLLPRRFGYWLFARFGDIAFFLSPQRRAVQDNLRHVLGPQVSDAELNRIAREVFRNQLRNYFDLFSLRRLKPSVIQQLVKIDRLDELLSGLDDGRGLIVVSAHFGNLDVAMQAVGLLGHPALLLVERLKPEKMFRYICSLRSRTGLTLMSVDGGLRQVFRALKANQMVLLAGDRDATNSGVQVDFFGAPACLPDGYARIARRTGARIAVVFCQRRPDNTFLVRGELLPPFQPTDDRDADVRAIMKQVVGAMERYIAEHPDQWMMFQPIWADEPARPPQDESGKA